MRLVQQLSMYSVRLLSSHHSEGQLSYLATILLSGRRSSLRLPLSVRLHPNNLLSYHLRILYHRDAPVRTIHREIRPKKLPYAILSYLFTGAGYHSTERVLAVDCLGNVRDHSDLLGN